MGNRNDAPRAAGARRRLAGAGISITSRSHSNNAAQHTAAQPTAQLRHEDWRRGSSQLMQNNGNSARAGYGRPVRKATGATDGLWGTRTLWLRSVRGRLVFSKQWKATEKCTLTTIDREQRVGEARRIGGVGGSGARGCAGWAKCELRGIRYTTRPGVGSSSCLRKKQAEHRLLAWVGRNSCGRVLGALYVPRLRISEL